jgi:hypothetical protein
MQEEPAATDGIPVPNLEGGGDGHAPRRGGKRNEPRD